MPRTAKKLFQITPLSIGLDTIEKIREVQLALDSWKYHTMRKNTSKSETCELAMRIGLPILKGMIDRNDVMLRGIFESGVYIIPETVTKPKAEKKQASTLAEMTDDDFAKMETETETDT